MADGKLNSVVILDALPDSDLQTARRLFEELRGIATNKAHGLDVRYYKIKNLSELKDVLAGIASATLTHGMKPWLHLECHGLDDESGFVFPDKSSCDWTQLKKLITPININSDFNLMLILAACYGGSFTAAITTIDRAPVFGLIGPVKEILAGEIDVDFPEFYTNFFNTGSLTSALISLKANRPNSYYYTDAEKFFYDVWVGYKKHYCSKESINQRSRNIRKLAKSNGAIKVPSLGNLKRLYRKEEPKSFNKYRDLYFMFDLNPINKSRYPVTYQKAEAYIRGVLPKK